MKTLTKALSLGLEIAFSLILPILGGLYLDKMLHCKPVGILLGVAVGLGLVVMVLTSFVKHS